MVKGTRRGTFPLSSPLQACKPDSVTLAFTSAGHHLSVRAVTRPARSAYPSRSFVGTKGRPGRTPSRNGHPPREHGIYMAFQHARFTPPAHHCAGPQALTLHFHHYPCRTRRTGAVIFCGTVCSRRLRDGTRLFTGALPCAVRTFLPAICMATRWPGLQ
jgi:hypothetical protein